MLRFHAQHSMVRILAIAGRADAASKYSESFDRIMLILGGRFDIAESLFEGSTYLKSTLHTNKPGGDSDYIERPTSDTMKLAVVFSSSSSTIHIQVLPADTDFPSTLAASDINKMCQATPDNQVSHFSVT